MPALSGRYHPLLFPQRPSQPVPYTAKLATITEEADTAPIPEIAALGLPTYWQSTYNRLNAETWPLVQAASSVYIAGVFTDVSVYTTALAIFDANKPVYVVTDCVASLHGEDVHHAALKSLDFAIGKRYLVSAEQVVTAVD